LGTRTDRFASHQTPELATKTDIKRLSSRALNDEKNAPQPNKTVPKPSGADRRYGKTPAPQRSPLMALFTIAYDLHEGPLIDELKRLEGVETRRSVWLIALDNTNDEALAHFKGFLPTEDDKLLVIEF
jgi:hypothetical protein